MKEQISNLFIYLGFYVAFNTLQVISRWVVGRAEETSTYKTTIRVLYCELPTNGKQLPAFPLEEILGTEPQPQTWEAKVLPLCHRGSLKLLMSFKNVSIELIECGILQIGSCNYFTEYVPLVYPSEHNKTLSYLSGHEPFFTVILWG